MSARPAPKRHTMPMTLSDLRRIWETSHQHHGIGGGAKSGALNSSASDASHTGCSTASLHARSVLARHGMQERSPAEASCSHRNASEFPPANALPTPAHYTFRMVTPTVHTPGCVTDATHIRRRAPGWMHLLPEPGSNPAVGSARHCLDAAGMQGMHPKCRITEEVRHQEHPGAKEWRRETTSARVPRHAMVRIWIIRQMPRLSLTSRAYGFRQNAWTTTHQSRHLKFVIH